MDVKSGRVSVVVPSYGRPQEITRLARQLNAQTLPPDAFEVIVVDDGSPIDVRTVLRHEAHRYELRVLRQSNTGSSAARRHGAEHAGGELLVFIDDDMSVGPDFLQAHLNAHRDEDRLVVLGRRRAGHQRDRLPLVERYRVSMGDQLADDVATGKLQLGGQFLYTGNVSLRRLLYEQVGGFDPEFREICDVELGIRLERAGARFVLSEAAYNVHERDLMTAEQWLARGVLDGVYWSQVGAKHPDVWAASPWHWLEVVNPVSRPLLGASALAPGAAGALASVGLASAGAAAAMNLERVAMAAASFVWGVQVFRGVGQEAGDARAALREYREFRRSFKDFSRPGGNTPSAFRELVEAVKEDHRMLAQAHERYDPRWRDAGSGVAASIANAGFQIVFGYRVMRCMRALGLPLAARMIARTVRHAFGADIHWDADLAPGLVVVHGFGLAISHAARSGHGCILSQNVTLGLSRDPATGVVGAPDLGEDVSVGPGAALIGPIVIGAGSKIMANCTVVTSVPAQSIVEAPAVSIRPR